MPLILSIYVLLSVLFLRGLETSPTQDDVACNVIFIVPANHARNACYLYHVEASKVVESVTTPEFTAKVDRCVTRVLAALPEEN